MRIHRDGPRGYACDGSPHCVGCARERAIHNHREPVQGHQHDLPKDRVRLDSVAWVVFIVAVILWEVFK
jgi:hypothetical protein